MSENSSSRCSLKGESIMKMQRWMVILVICALIGTIGCHDGFTQPALGETLAAPAVGKTVTNLQIDSLKNRIIDLNKKRFPDPNAVMPGDTIKYTVKLIAPVALEEKTRFAIREGGKTVGAGVVTKIIK